LNQLKRYSEAESYLAKILQDKPNNIDVQLAIADNAMIQGKYASASRVYRNLLDNDETQLSIWIKLTDSLYASQLPKDSLEAINHAVQLAPESDLELRVEILRKRATVYTMLKNYSLAISDLEQALTLLENNTDARIDLAQVYWANQNQTKAIDQLSIVIRSNNNDCRAINLAYTWKVKEFDKNYLNSKCIQK